MTISTSTSHLAGIEVQRHLKVLNETALASLGPYVQAWCRPQVQPCVLPEQFLGLTSPSSATRVGVTLLHQGGSGFARGPSQRDVACGVLGIQPHVGWPE